MKKTQAKRKAGGRTNAAGRELIAALREAAHAVSTGDYSKAIVRTVEIPEPSRYGAREVRALRDSLGVSQGVFAAMVGVTKAQVGHWEHGIRVPSPLACRFFDKIKENPTAFRDSLIHRKSA